MSDLFPELPRTPSRVSQVKAALETWKKENGVFTHRANHMEHPWSALAFEKAKEVLSGYELSDEEKTYPGSLIAGYCRLLDDSGLLVCAGTELKACRALAESAKLPPI